MNKLEQKKPKEFRKLQWCICEPLGLVASDLNEDANLESDLDCDDLDKIEILMESERVFGVNITDEEWESVVILGDLYKVILSKL